MTDDLDAELAAFEQQSKVLLAKESSAPTAAQGSPAWLAERVGSATCSRFKDVMNFLKNGKPSQKRIDYAEELIIERVTGQPYEHYVSKPMENGLELEPRGKMAYEARTGLMLASCGFVHHKTVKNCGGSPDSRIYPKGGIELKCPTPITHYETIVNGMHDDHKPQVHGHIWLADADWWDFVSYCPIFPPPLDLYIQRIARDDDYLAELAGNVMQFLSEVDELHQKLLAIAGPQAIQAQDESRAPADSASELAGQA